MNNAEVFSENLTDGSKVWSVRTPCADGGSVIFACVNEKFANQLADALRSGCVDVSLRD
jgi:hypothetical protein